MPARAASVRAALAKRGASRHESLLRVAGARYLWVALGLSALALIAYLADRSTPVANGGTWLGYTLGTTAALLIVWLMLLGIRKRSYASRLGTVQGWASAHVYLGTALIPIALLHAGFRVGWNVHTLLLVLMFLVIGSGFFGVFAYLRYPAFMTRNRDGASRDAMLQRIADIDQRALTTADRIDPKLHAIVLRSIARTRLGGKGLLSELRARDGSVAAITQIREAIVERQTVLAMPAQPVQAPAAGQTMFAMVDYLAHSQDDTSIGNLRSLIDLLAQKHELARRIVRDVQLQALLELWLYVHVPLSFALLAALIAHIVAVFFYW
ncbi:MAG: hypothetical protein ABI451_06195 [Dokdonella sp.]